MNQIEFYSYDDEVWYRTADGETDILDERHYDIIDQMFEIIKENYKDSFEALEEKYGKSKLNATYYRYVMVKRFIKCNFSRIDTTYIDVDSFGGQSQMNFERVDCPLRGECQFEGRICQPRFSTRLTEREMTVAKYWYDGKRKEEIAELMYLSAETINSHIRRIYMKLDVHSDAEFVKLADAKRLFDKPIK